MCMSIWMQKGVWTSRSWKGFEFRESIREDESITEDENQWILCDGVASIFGREAWYACLGYAGPQPELLTMVGRVVARNRELDSLDYWRELGNGTRYN